MAGGMIIKGGSFLIEAVDAEDIFIPEDMDTDQKLLGRILEDYLRAEVEPRIDEMETKTEGLMVELIKKAAQVGFLGVNIPERFGGLGLDNISSLIVTEKSAIGGPFALANLITNTFAAVPILYFGNDKQRERYLPALANGNKIGAFALTEPDAGTDALSAKTTATPSGDGQYYVLNGEKQFISNTGYADVFITFAKIGGENFTAFILDRDSKGISVGEEEDKMGIHGTSTRSLILEDVRIPVENLLFDIGRGAVVAFNTLNIGRYRLSGLCTGTAKLAFENSVRYAKKRVQFGQRIADFGLIKEKIGEMAIRIFGAESVVYRSARLLEEGLKAIRKSSDETALGWASAIREYAAECSINKVYASEMLDYVADEAVQIHGGYGYLKDYPVERYYRDSRIHRIFGGTNEINALLICRMLLKGTGQLLLRDAMQNVASGMVGLSESALHQRKGLEELARLVENAKRIALLSLKTVMHTYPDDFECHQELIGMVSKMIVEVFAMESILIRTQKIKRRWGEERCEIPMAISQVYILDAFMRIERWGKLTLAATAKEDVVEEQLLTLRKLTQYTPVNSVSLRRSIADSMLKAGRYFVL